MLRLAVFAALVAIVCGQTTQVAQCTQNDGDLPVNAYIAGCSTPPCSLPQLENAIINIIFRPPGTIHSMTTLATAYLSLVPGLQPVPIPYPLGQYAVTCNFLENSYCPVLRGETIVYTLHFYIQPTFPVGISTTVEFRIVDENSEPIVCIRVPILITAPNSRHASHNATLGIGAN